MCVFGTCCFTYLHRFSVVTYNASCRSHAENTGGHMFVEWLQERVNGQRIHAHTMMTSVLPVRTPLCSMRTPLCFCSLLA